MRTLRKYKDTEEYIQHQLEKTLNKDRISRSAENREAKIQEFKARFKIIDNIGKDARILCVGSRDGEEVQTFNELGYYDVTGIDLAEFKPYTQKMDMHNLQFEDDSFDIVYTNSLDHSNDIDKALREITRVLRVLGILVVEIELNNYRGNYETIEFNSVDDVLKILKKTDIEFEYWDLSFIQIYCKNLLCVNHNKHTLFISIKDKNAKPK